MSISIKYMSQLKALLGQGTDQIETQSACTWRELAEQLVQRHGEPLRKLLYSNEGELNPSLLVCIGDEQIRPTAAHPIQPGQTVTLLSPISGG